MCENWSQYYKTKTREKIIIYTHLIGCMPKRPQGTT